MNIAFLGGGNMAQAIAFGLIRSQAHPAQQIIIHDRNQPIRDLWRDQGCTVSNSLTELIAQAELLVIAIKPQSFSEVASQLSRATPGLLVSIMAGISCDNMQQIMGDAATNWRYVRTMPNLPLAYGKGCTGIAKGPHATSDDIANVEKIFKPTGTVVHLDESQINALAAISGSGPAYFFRIVELMAQAGQQAGLDRETAQLTAKQACIGAATILAQSDDSPATWRKRVTSRGGTTAAALEIFEQGDLPELVNQAVQANIKRSCELGQTAATT